MTARPPDRITVVWCPVCGRDDRITALKKGPGRHFANGKMCPGTPQEQQYVPPPVPVVLPALDDGKIRGAVAVEVAIQPSFPHLGGGRMSFVGRCVQYWANTPEELAQLAELILHEMAAELPDAIAPHPRPEGRRYS